MLGPALAGTLISGADPANLPAEFGLYNSDPERQMAFGESGYIATSGAAAKAMTAVPAA